MEHSRTRRLLGVGLVLLGGLLLLRALVGPVAFVSRPMPPEREIERIAREEQQAQLDIRRAELEVQREIRHAELESQRELQLAEREAQRAPELDVPEVPPLPAIPPIPPVPPVPPAPPLFHLGMWLNPAAVLLALLALLVWRRGRRDREAQL